MPTTLTLKGIPDDVYDRLKIVAELHRRSLNNEAIACLEVMLLPSKATAAERIASARKLRGSLDSGAFTSKSIDEFKRQGRA